MHYKGGAGGISCWKRSGRVTDDKKIHHEAFRNLSLFTVCTATHLHERVVEPYTWLMFGQPFDIYATHLGSFSSPGAKFASHFLQLKF